MTKNLFTAQEDAYITKHYFVKTSRVIGKALGRTRNSIVSRAHRLGLTAYREQGRPRIHPLPEPKPKAKQHVVVYHEPYLTEYLYGKGQHQLAYLAERRKRYATSVKSRASHCPTGSSLLASIGN